MDKQERTATKKGLTGSRKAEALEAAQAAKERAKARGELREPEQAKCDEVQAELNKVLGT